MCMILQLIYILASALSKTGSEDQLQGGGGGEGGSLTEVHISYPKNLNFRICLPKFS